MSRYIALELGCVPSHRLSVDGFDTVDDVEGLGPDDRRRLQPYHPPPADLSAEDDLAPATIRVPREAQRRLVLEAFADDEITLVNAPTSELRGR